MHSADWPLLWHAYCPVTVSGFAAVLQEVQQLSARLQALEEGVAHAVSASQAASGIVDQVLIALLTEHWMH